MSYEKTMKDVELLVESEYDMAAEKWGGKFASRHEGASVIREEFEEAIEEMEEIQKAYKAMWLCVRRDFSKKVMADAVDDVYNHAVEAACELIQVAAMAYKMLATLAEEKEDEDGKD